MYIGYSDRKLCDHIDWRLENTYTLDNRIGIMCLTRYDFKEIENNTVVKEISCKYKEYKKNERAEREKGQVYILRSSVRNVEPKFELSRDLYNQAGDFFDGIEEISILSITNEVDIITVIPTDLTKKNITYTNFSYSLDKLVLECRNNNYKKIIICKSQFNTYGLEWEAILPMIKDRFEQIEIDILILE